MNLHSVPLYDTIGIGYENSRPADARIVTALISALEVRPGATLMDVGAGTGKYSRALADQGFSVVAIEPSEVMRAQSIAHPRVRWVAAASEDIPLPAGAAEGAFIVLALHHFNNRAQALREILRVIGRGPLVIFTFEPQKLGQFWLADYFPDLGKERRTSFSELADVAEEVKSLTTRSVRCVSFPLPRDLQDKFAAAAWASPESYLDPDVRNGISSFSLMTKEAVASGCDRLAADLASGHWDTRYGKLRTQSAYDAGYRFIIAEDI